MAKRLRLEERESRRQAKPAALAGGSWRSRQISSFQDLLCLPSARVHAMRESFLT
jgi:hypothetical protein